MGSSSDLGLDILPHINFSNYLVGSLTMITPTNAEIIAKTSHLEHVSLSIRYDKMVAHIGIVYMIQTLIESGIY